jgi:hypothetical protein
MIAFRFRKPATKCSTEYVLGNITIYQQQALRTMLENKYSYKQIHTFEARKKKEERKEEKRAESKHTAGY